MIDYKQFYRDIYSAFRSPLNERSGVAASSLDAAALRLGIAIPTALRDFYLIAGRERWFNLAHNRLIAPKEWVIDKQRLIFLVENQAVVYWGVSLRSASNDDPPVSQGVNDDPIEWNPEHRRCSVFIAVMLCWQAVSGGMKFMNLVEPNAGTRKRLDKNWTFVGEVNNMRAYHRDGQVVCLCPDFGPECLFGGASSKSKLESIAHDLELNSPP